MYARIVHTIAGVSMFAAVKNAHVQIAMMPQFNVVVFVIEHLRSFSSQTMVIALNWANAHP